MSFLDPSYDHPDAGEAVRLRRIIKMQLAVIVSLLLHIVLFAVLTLVPVERRAAILARVSAAEPPPTPVPITFASPRPQPPSEPPPSPERPRFQQERPPPDALVDPKATFRMDPTRKLNPPSPAPQPGRANGVAGREDRRPEGGSPGGDLPRPAAGSPRGAAVGDPAFDEGAFRENVPDEPDLSGRLRDFRRALSQPRPPSPEGPEGGGSGKGGVQVPALPETGFGVGNLQFESRDFDWSDYGRAVYIAIWRAWHNRLLMLSGNFERWAAVRVDWGLEHTSGVRFTITRSGQVEDVAVETESGCQPLDASAYETLREVVLPPLPADFPRAEEKVHARFVATGDVRSMRRSLEWLKARGYF